MKFLHLRVALASLLGIVYVYAAPDLPTVTTPSPATTPCFQPPTSTDPSKWSSNEYIDKNMIIPAASTAIFWMGRVPNTTESVLLKAQDCAITSTHRPDCQRNHDKKLDHKCQQVRMIVERINSRKSKPNHPTLHERGSSWFQKSMQSEK